MNLSRTSVVLIALSMMVASGSSVANNRSATAATDMSHSDSSIDLNRSDTATRGQSGPNNGSGYSGALRGNPGTNDNTGTYGMDRNGDESDRVIRNTTDPNIVTDSGTRDEYASRQEQEDLHRGFPIWSVLALALVALGGIYFVRRQRRADLYR